MSIECQCANANVRRKGSDHERKWLNYRLFLYRFFGGEHVAYFGGSGCFELLILGGWTVLTVKSESSMNRRQICPTSEIRLT